MGLRSVGDGVEDGMAKVVTGDVEAGVAPEVGVVIELTDEIGDTSGRGMNT
jgi:hypothetical protein